MIRRLCLCLFAATLCAEEPVPDRYEVRFANGDIVLDKEIRDWNQDKKQPKIANRNLFDAGNPAVMVRDRTLSSRLQAPYVALANGDLLPGRVIGANSADENGHLSGHFLVVPRPPLDAYLSGQQIVRVHADRVTRIVFREFTDRLLAPGDVRFTNGRVVRVKSVRWRESGLRALTEDGLVTASWNELAEIRLPAPNIHAAIMDDLHPPENPEKHPRLARLETTGGAVLTYWQDLLLRDKDRRQFNCHSLQPSWALNAIRVPIERVVTRSYRAPSAIPLSILPAKALSQKTMTGYLWPWRRDRNVRGGPLASGAEIADYGVGTHAYSEIAFDLPEIATHLRGRVGLDRVVGSGGCCELRIFRDTVGGKALWESGVRTGGQDPQRFDVEIAGAKRLILQTDYAHDNRPKGADPMDIRDEASWLQPVIIADSAKLQTQQVLERYFPLLQKWKMTGEATMRQRFDRKTGAWRPALLTVHTNERAKPVLTFQRELKVSMRNAHLQVGMGRDDPRIDGHGIAIHVNGEALESSHNGNPNSNRAQGHIDVRAWSLGPWIGQTVTIEAQVLATKTGETSGLIIDEISLSPLIEGLSRGKLLKPDLPLAQVAPAHVHLEGGGELTDGKICKSKPVDLTFRRVPFASGYGINGGSRIVYDLHPSWQRFVTGIGMVDGWADVRVALYLDDKEKPFWESEKIGRGKAGKQVDVPIPPGHRQLIMRVDGSSGHYAGFLQPGFVTDGTPYEAVKKLENHALGASVTASSSREEWEGEGPPNTIVDGDPTTRWSSNYADEEQLILDLGEPKTFSTLTLLWEVAAAKRYRITLSDDKQSWREVSVHKDGIQGPRTDSISLDGETARYLRIELQERATEYGYSLYEIRIE